MRSRSRSSPSAGTRATPASSGSRRPAISGSVVATGRGDDGTTGLLFGGDRVAKDDPRVEAYGTIDEAVASLGVVRALLRDPGPAGGAPGLAELPDLVLRLQRELFVAAAELATDPERADRLVEGTSRVSESMLAGLEALLAEHERRIELPREFVVPGETRLSAALEVARTVLRRAERRTVELGRAGSAGGSSGGLIAGSLALPYLNRLADLLWVLAREAEAAESRPTTPSRPDRRRRARPAASPAGPRAVD